MVWKKETTPIEIEVNSKKKEQIEKILNRQSTADSFLAWLSSTESLLRKENKIEMLNVVKTIKEKYLSFNTERITLSKIQGKGTFSMKKNGEVIEVTTYQDKKPVITLVLNEDINFLDNKIRLLIRNGEELKSRDLAIQYSKWKGLGYTWKDFFCDRKIHNYFTICLRILREENLIEYRGGIIRLK
jgi:hypothetical protein